MNKLFFAPGSQEECGGGQVNPAGPHEPKGFDILVNNKNVRMTSPVVTREMILETSGHEPASCFSLYMKLPGCDFERVAPGQEIHLQNPGVERFETKDPDVFQYWVNKDHELTDKKEMTARTILIEAGLDPAKVYLVEQKPARNELVYAFKENEPICMDCRGIHFITREWLETVDIEEYGKHCKDVPPAKHYLVKVDKEKFIWDQPTISAEQLIKFIHSVNPGNYNLVKFMGNSPKPVPVPFTATVNLLECCLLRFVVQPKTQNDGLGSFSLPEEDADYLNALGLTWETVNESNLLWVLIHDYTLPAGYQVSTCSVALQIPPSYPAAEIDMAYFHPPLTKQSGRAISAISPQVITGKTFQRWSRHRQPGEWKPGIDCIGTHLLLVNNWLENDLNR